MYLADAGMAFCFQVLMVKGLIVKGLIVKGLMVKGLFPRLDALYPTEAEACRDRVKQHPSLVSRLSQAIGPQHPPAASQSPHYRQTKFKRCAIF